MSIAAVGSPTAASMPADSAGRTNRPGAPPTPRQQALRQAVDELVGSVFFGEIFRALRNSRLQGPYGHGGRGEEIFSAQLHGILAERMGHGARLGINDSLYRRLAGKV